MPVLVIGTRGSPLARRQTEMVVAALRAAVPELAEPDAIGIEVVRTSGDRFVDRPLAEIGGNGLFTREIEERLAAGLVDIAVHSLKDVPGILPEGLVFGAFLPREDPRDVLVGAEGLDALPRGARVGTSSPRRAAQLLERRPDLAIVPLRGNVETRIARVREGAVAATLLARAGLVRLGADPGTHRVLDASEMLPAVGQGVIAVECRADDVKTLDLVARIDHLPTRTCVEAERAFLAELGGSCRTPIAGLCEADGDRLLFRGLVAAPDGSRVWRVSGRAPAAEAAALGRDAGRRLVRAVPELLSA
ncbi:Porphobilinogen deaminase [bacterium HR39]|nr:Porphobilinogen deaminase [bacterium HR39]